MGPQRRALLCQTLRLCQEFGSTCTASELNRRFDPLYSSNSALAILTTLSLEGPQRPSQLQACSGLTSAGLSHLIDRLADAGMVTRSQRRLVHDLRAVSVELTASGRRREAALVDTILAGLRESAPALKEVVVSLEAAGARPTIVQAALPRRRAASHAARSLAGVGIELVRALQLPNPDTGATDQTAALTLAIIADAGSRRPTYLADVLGVSTGGVTRLLDRLEGSGFIERSFASVPGDRRSVVVTLTPAGLEQLDRVLTKVADHLVALLDGVLDVSRLLVAATQ